MYCPYGHFRFRPQVTSAPSEQWSDIRFVLPDMEQRSISARGMWSTDFLPPTHFCTLNTTEAQKLVKVNLKTRSVFVEGDTGQIVLSIACITVSPQVPHFLRRFTLERIKNLALQNIMFRGELPFLKIWDRSIKLTDKGRILTPTGAHYYVTTPIRHSISSLQVGSVVIVYLAHCLQVGELVLSVL